MLLATLCHMCGCNSNKEYQRNQEIDSCESSPPQLNIYQPVDYVKWLIEFSGQDRNHTQEYTYEEFIEQVSDNKTITTNKNNDEIMNMFHDYVDGPIWDPNDYPETNTYLMNLTECIKTFKKCARKLDFKILFKPDHEYPYNPAFVKTPVIEWSAHFIDIILVESWRKVPDQANQLIQAWETCLRHAAHLQSVGSFYHHRIALEAKIKVYSSMRSAIRYKLLNTEDCNRAFIVLMDTATEMDIDHVVYSEWASMLGLVQALYPKGELDRSLARILNGVDVNGLSRSHVPPQLIAQEIDTYFYNIAKVLSHYQNQNVSDILALLRTTPTALVNHPLKQTLFPSFERLYLNQMKSITAFRATVIIFKLYEYHREHASWPKYLSEIELENKLLIDPFSGKQFIYNNDNTPLLYSVSMDGIDDKGIHEEWAYWQTEQDGKDYVFWPPQ